MEEKSKNSNLSPIKNKLKDLLKKEKKKKEQVVQKSSLSVSERFQEFEISYKNKELNKFKDDILSYLRTRDNYYIESINTLKSKNELFDGKLNHFFDTLQQNSKNFLALQAELTTNLDKIKSHDTFVSQAKDKLISHEIRINSLREDFSTYFQKYDKIYLDNLEVPGYIGRCSKYPNCKMFFIDVIKDLDKLNTYREKNILDLNTYKERLESIIKNFQSMVDNNNDTQLKYISQLNEKTNKSILDELEEKISIVRLENSKFVGDLLNRTSDLNELYDKMKQLKEYVLKEFQTLSDDNNKKVEEAKNSFDEFKIEFEIIRKKFLDLAEFIKSGKFAKNFGNTFAKKEVNLIHKRLFKDIRETIDAKDVKIINNLEDILYGKTNYIEEKENKINRLSKSQTNFNSNNKKNYGFSQNEQNNTNKINNNEVKVYQGGVVYLNINSNDNNTTASTLKSKGFKKNKINHKEKNSDLLEIERRNNLNEEYSNSDSYFSNMNKSNTTFSTTTDKTKTNNILSNNNKINQFIIQDEDSQHENKIIKELSSELEQSSAKVNKLASNQKEIEDKFKMACNNIQPANLKLTNKGTEENVKEEQNNDKTKEKQLLVNKIDSNAVGYSSTDRNNYDNINFNKEILNRCNRVNKKVNKIYKNEEIYQKKDDFNNNIDTKSAFYRGNKLLYNNALNENLLNDTINFGIDRKMNLYDRKIGELESFTRGQIYDIFKQINILKKTYSVIATVLKKDKNKINGYNSIYNIPDITNSNNGVHNENKNTLNSSGNNFLKKSEKNIKSSKSHQNFDLINFNDRLFYNGKYYYNIKDIFDKTKGSLNFENKKLLKQLDNKLMEDIYKNNNKNSNSSLANMNKPQSAIRI